MLGVVGALAACARPSTGEGTPSVESAPPDLELKGVTLRSWRGPKLKVVATAQAMTVDRASHRFVAHGAEATLVEPKIVVAAPTVEGDAQAKELQGSRGVQLTGPNELRGTSESARFDGALGRNGQASSAVPVEVASPNARVSAQGFTFDVAEQRCDFVGPVSSSLKEQP